MAHGHDMASVRRMTERQLRLFYNQAQKRLAKDQAALLDSITVALIGKPSAAAKSIRDQLKNG